MRFLFCYFKPLLILCDNADVFNLCRLFPTAD